MQYVYVLKPVRAEMALHRPTQEEEAIVEEHLRYQEELNRRGVVLLAGHTTTEDDMAFAMCVIEAPSEPVARDIMNKDPAVWRGVMTGEIHPFRVTMLAETALQS